jgi:hypothetical protein
MTGLPSVLRGFAEQSLGPCQVVATLTGSQGGAGVVRVRDARGFEYIAKRHGSAEKHNREVHAYRRWAPALVGGAAQLVTADPGTMTILITALPGHPSSVTEGTPPQHRQAGVLLRLLHDAEPARPLHGFQQWLTDRISWWRQQSAPLLTAEDKQVIDQHLAAMHALGVPASGPCHFDFQPRNWLLDRGGTLRLIDFEHARIGLQVRDFTRLHFRCWPSRPDLREAFFDGYGRRLTPVEQETVRHCGAIDALTALVRGAQTGDTALVAHSRATLARLRDEE